MSSQIILAELRSIRESIESLVRSRTVPKAHSMAEAGRLLSVSVRTLQRMVSTGQIQSVEIGARRMIPASEVEMLTTPLPALPVRLRTRALSHTQELAKATATIGKRRRG